MRRYLLFILLLSPEVCFAQNGIFAIDVEQNKRLDRLEAAVFPKEAKQVSPGMSLQDRPVGKALPLNHAPAYQIINGVLHHTSDAHLIQHGYSPEDLVGLTPAQKDALHGAAHGTQQLTQPAKMQPQYQMICNGRSCRRVRRSN